MAAQAVPPDPAPAIEFRRRLCLFRERDVPFDQAWAVAIKRTYGDWRTAFEWSRPEWQAAYNREPPVSPALFLAEGDEDAPSLR